MLYLIDTQQTLVKFNKILLKVMKQCNYCNKNGWLTSIKPGDDPSAGPKMLLYKVLYECWNFNSGNYLFTTDTK